MRGRPSLAHSGRYRIGVRGSSVTTHVAFTRSGLRRAPTLQPATARDRDARFFVRSPRKNTPGSRSSSRENGDPQSSHPIVASCSMRARSGDERSDGRVVQCRERRHRRNHMKCERRFDSAAQPNVKSLRFESSEKHRGDARLSCARPLRPLHRPAPRTHGSGVSSLRCRLSKPRRARPLPARREPWVGGR